MKQKNLSTLEKNTRLSTSDPRFKQAKTSAVARLQAEVKKFEEERFKEKQKYLHNDETNLDLFNTRMYYGQHVVFARDGWGFEFFYTTESRFTCHICKSQNAIACEFGADSRNIRIHISSNLHLTNVASVVQHLKLGVVSVTDFKERNKVALQRLMRVPKSNFFTAADGTAFLKEGQESARNRLGDGFVAFCNDGSGNLATKKHGIGTTVHSSDFHTKYLAADIYWVSAGHGKKKGVANEDVTLALQRVTEYFTAKDDPQKYSDFDHEGFPHGKKKSHST